MSGNIRFSKEIKIVNSLRKYLITSNYHIIQLVASGGQCSVSLTFTDFESERRSTCYPDLICVGEESIIIGEVKPRFSIGDRDKLLRIIRSPDAQYNIIRLVKLRFPNLKTNSVRYILVHGDLNSQPDSDIDQLIFPNDYDVISKPKSLS
jgi:hypothetical protein